MSWITPTPRATGYLVTAVDDWNVLVADLIFLKTSIDDTGTIWTGSVSGTVTGTVSGTVTGTVAGTRLVIPQVVSAATATTLTPNSGTTDITRLTAQASALSVANPAGSPHDGQTLIFELTDDGTAQSLSWGTAYAGSLPAQTVPGSTLVVTAIYNAATTSWVATSSLTSAPRVATTASAATLTPDVNTTDIASLTAQAVALTVAAPTGSPVDGQPLTLRIKDNGTAQAITWNSVYAGGLPTKTIPGFVLDVAFQWDAATSTWLQTTAPRGVLLDVRDYGAKCDGTTDDTAAIQAVLNAASGGGTIVFPSGGVTCLCAGQITLASLTNVFVEGNGATLSYSGVNSPFITIASCARITWRHLTFQYTSTSFTGTLVTTASSGTDPAYLYWEDCVFAGNGSAINASYLLSLDHAIVCAVERCRFTLANYGLVGSLTTYSNVVAIRSCTFLGLNTCGALNAGQNWTFDNCTFEGLVGTKAGAYTTNRGYFSYGLRFVGCWFGDAGSGGTWINGVQSLGFEVAGCYFGTPGGSLSASNCDIRCTGSEGVHIHGNRFDSGGRFDFYSSFSYAVALMANDFAGNAPSFITSSYQDYLIAANYGGSPSSDQVPTVLTGTFTPTITASTSASGQVYSTQAGTYVKIGKFVHFQGYVQLSTLGTLTGNVQFGGLPFTSDGSSSNYSVLQIGYFSGMTSSFTWLTGQIITNSTIAQLEGVKAAATAAVALAQADLSNTTALVFSGCYQSAS